MIDQAVIEEAGRRLAHAAGESAQVVLFGSHARGDAGAEVENEAEESVRLSRELRDLRVPVDVVVVSRGYADAWRGVTGSIVHSAFGHGHVLAG